MPTAPATRSIATRFLVELLDQRGVACDDLLSAAGLLRQDLASPELLTPWREFAALWRRAADVEPAVGLMLCERFPEGQMHVLTHLALRSATVGEALDAIARYFSAVSPAERIVVERRGPDVALQYGLDPGVPAIPWLVEHYFSLSMLFFGRALGKPLPVRAVELRGERGADAKAYLARFGVAPRFGSPHDAIVLSGECVGWELPTRDAYLRGILERVAAQHAAMPQVAPWSARVGRFLAESLLQSRPATLSAAARHCNATERTLRARLADERATFRGLLDETRRSLAEEHLARGLSATSVAYLLGFSEPAAFQHACRRWFGKAAGAVRKSTAT